MNVKKLKEGFYGPDQRDNDGVFRAMIYEAVSRSSRVLDAGAGAGNAFSYDLKSSVQEIIGVDLDPRMESNPQLHLGIRSDLTKIPLPDNNLDVIFSRYVLEHIQDPQAFLKEGLPKNLWVRQG